VEELRVAIQHGNSKAEIFSDPDCYLYLTFLMKSDESFFCHGMTAYAYLMALMQFTDMQPLKEEDQHIKVVCEIKIDLLSNGNKLTEEGEKFLKLIHHRIVKLGYPLDYNDLETYILHLPPVEQWLIKIPYRSPNRKDLTDIDKLFDIVISNIPFCHYEQNSQDTVRHGFIPSASVMQYILQKMSPKPIHMMPIFGAVSVATVRQLHAHGKHPVLLYGLHVKSNPKMIHAYLAGPFLTWLHDIVHVVGGSMLSPAERDILFNDFIPQMESLLIIAQQHQDDALVEKIQHVIMKAIDFDLTDIRSFCDNDRFMKYLSRTFGMGRANALYPLNKVEYEKIGDIVEDRLYFLLLKMHHELTPGKQKIFWSNVIDTIQIGKHYREIHIVNAIKQVARASANLPKEYLQSCYFELSMNECQRWLVIIDPSKTSAEAWETIFKEKKEYQFSKLASRGWIAFFHPYLPLTPEMRASFKAVLDERILQLTQLKSIDLDSKLETQAEVIPMLR